MTSVQLQCESTIYDSIGKSTLSVFIAENLVLSCNATCCSMHIGMSYCIVKQQLMEQFLFITRMQNLNAMISLQLFLNKLVVVCSSIAIVSIQYEYD